MFFWCVQMILKNHHFFFVLKNMDCWRTIYKNQCPFFSLSKNMTYMRGLGEFIYDIFYCLIFLLEFDRKNLKRSSANPMFLQTHKVK